MAKRTLRTPILATLLAVAASGTWFFQYRESVPVCTAVEGEFCIEVNIHPGRDRHQDSYIVVVVDYDEMNHQTQFVRQSGGRLPAPGETIDFTKEGTNVANGSDADFEAIEAVARIHDAPTEMLVAVPPGRYFVCVNDYFYGVGPDKILCVYVDGPEGVAGMNGPYRADLVVGMYEF